MTCYFVRHGAAVDPAEWSGSDFDRPLTEKGRERMAHVAKRLSKLGVAVDVIVTSPLLRAKETAAIIGETLDPGGRIAEDPRLADGFDARGLASMLREHESAEALMLVGHEPTMSATLARMTGGVRVDFKKGAIACVDVTDPQSPSGVLLWMVPPRLLVG